MTNSRLRSGFSCLSATVRRSGLLAVCLAPVLHVAVLHVAAHPAAADTFTIKLDDDRLVAVHARHHGTGQGAIALEFSDGQLQVVPEDRVVKRDSGADPTPLTCEEMLERLGAEFDAGRIVSEIDKPFVIVLVRSSNGTPDAATLRQYQGVTRKAAKFFKAMQYSFLQFLKQARVETTPARYPLVALIFESDRQFDAYTASVTGQKGLSAPNVAAFYDLLTNRLVIRLRECQSFDTPLHEAVHQQVYNRGVFQRLAPIPAWFNEGLATGFEGDGEKMKVNPRVVSDRYAPLAMRAKVVDWAEVVANDRAFQGDVLAAEAYGQAWGMHWMLVNRYRNEYHKFVRHLSQKQPLSLDRPTDRVAEFEQFLGKTIHELQLEFQQELPRAINRRSR